MKWFFNIKTGAKLAIGFGLCIVLGVMVGVFSLRGMASMEENTNQISNGVVKRTAVLSELAGLLPEIRLYEYRHLVNTDKVDMKKCEDSITKDLDQITKNIEEYKSLARMPEDKSLIAEFAADWKTYAEGVPKQLEFGRANDEKNGLKNLISRRDLYLAASDHAKELAGWNVKRGATLAGQAGQTYDAAKVTVLVLVGSAIVFGLFIAWLISRYVTKALHEVGIRIESLDLVCLTNLGSAIDALSRGDLTAKIATGTKALDANTKDEFGELGRGINQMIKRIQGAVASFEESQGSLSRLLAQAKSSSESIAQAASQVSAGNTDLSQRTEEQASSLEETASSMEEMTSTVKQNADNGQLANQLASQARQVAEGGGAVVRDAVGAMSEINDGSKKIAEIISVIDEIAFQTNLLALNAAVEAARVGEQGRGFAVVAAEVRNLAGRSATAAKEIKALVNDSVEKVDEGSRLVNESGTRLEEIVASVKKVADVIAEISAASMEQAAGIEQVNKAVMQMEQVTQQNASLVEEVSAASLSMTRQASEMQSLVGQFQIDTKYVLALQQNAAARHAAELAEGTTGMAIRSRPQLKVVDHDDFEEF